MLLATDHKIKNMAKQKCGQLQCANNSLQAKLEILEKQFDNMAPPSTSQLKPKTLTSGTSSGEDMGLVASLFS